ncbi:nucleotide pyrophosphohydrolase [Cyanophage S-2L]|uniref:dATP/dGTP diphosphohydrolase n=2 Tax=Cyanophage S-2L TaxID=260586 RepID=DGTPH_BPS2L|nr:RecName: Full=dATP/dGTP diphosphohydrolase; AltName: Full=dATP/dGTP pyrophosphohydrolase [Cyanophage S-2L]QQG31318.1 nucleotide pyrophosphohydrolase [Cyanophage S-2L]
MPATVAELQAEIAAWIHPLNPDRRPGGTIAKLLEEIGELIASDRAHDPLEVADVLILALDLATLLGVDVTEAIRAKLAINRARSWARADNGAMRHIPGSDTPSFP